MVIPSNIITQILIHLPSKSVARFRCVSKSWLSLLTDSKFIQTHYKTLNRNRVLFCDNTYSCYGAKYGSNLYSVPPSNDHDDLSILKPTRLPIHDVLDDELITFNGSCHGLVLLSARNNEDHYKKLVLLNPTTRDSVRLPRPSYKPPKTKHESFITHHAHGVGYDSVTDDYKVITLTYFIKFNQPTINCLSIYSLKSNTWRQLQFIDSPYDCSDSPPAVYVNGFLHWVAKKPDGLRVIVAFSLAYESFRQVPSPGSCNIDREIMSNSDCKLVVLGGKLAIYVNDENLMVWLMNEYGLKKSWTKISLDIFDYEFPMEGPMIFDGNGKIWVADEGQMLIYKFEKRNLSENVYIWSSCKFRVFGSYVESLVSIPKKSCRTSHS